MSRRAVTLARALLVSTLIGALACICVSWWICWTDRNPRVEWTSHEWVRRWPEWPSNPSTTVEFKNPGITGYLQEAVDDREHHYFCVSAEAGWPRPALLGYSLRDSARNRHIGIGVSRWDHGSRTNLNLPVVPLWPGFAVDAVFYGAPVAVAWRLFASLRRRPRVGRGWCASCGYDLRGIETHACPECGTRPQRAKTKTPPRFT